MRKMGCDLGDILTKNEIKLSDLKNKKLGFDAYNTIYQFLSSIRDQYGNPLQNEKGQITSHIVGLFYRMSSILDTGVKPIFVFDGKPLDEKITVIKKRNEIRDIAKEKHREAMAAEDYENARKFGKQAMRITPEIVTESKELLEAFGIPCIDAIHDGEAQLAVMNEKGLLDGCISQDFDVLLFGGKNLYRNITISGKKKANGKSYSVTVSPEHLNLRESLEKQGLTREKLIWIAILIGNDFNEKAPKVGPKTALKLVLKHSSLEDIYKELEYSPNYDYKKVYEIFEKPDYKAVKEKDIQNTEPDLEKLTNLLVDKYSFSKERVESTLNKLKQKEKEEKAQPKLNRWF
ncbi:MAG: flap endonuclease-1 [Candidatus ainarchaeum sp.]|nr:flap endonuclease-1 [Candidatus ainarchaeum sp.]